jgi:hypothetical protein
VERGEGDRVPELDGDHERRRAHDRRERPAHDGRPEHDDDERRRGDTVAQPAAPEEEADLGDHREPPGEARNARRQAERGGVDGEEAGPRARAHLEEERGGEKGRERRREEPPGRSGAKGEADLLAREARERRREAEARREEEVRHDRRRERLDQRRARERADDERERAPEAEPPVVTPEPLEVVHDGRVEHGNDRAVEEGDRRRGQEDAREILEHEERHEEHRADGGRDGEEPAAEAPVVRGPRERDRPHPAEQRLGPHDGADLPAVEPEVSEPEREVGKEHADPQEDEEVGDDDRAACVEDAGLSQEGRAGATACCTRPWRSWT